MPSTHKKARGCRRDFGASRMKTDSIRTMHGGSEGRAASLRECRTRKSQDKGRGAERERIKNEDKGLLSGYMCTYLDHMFHYL